MLFDLSWHYGDSATGKNKSTSILDQIDSSPLRPFIEGQSLAAKT